MGERRAEREREGEQKGLKSHGCSLKDNGTFSSEIISDQAARILTRALTVCDAGRLGRRPSKIVSRIAFGESARQVGIQPKTHRHCSTIATILARAQTAPKLPQRQLGSVEPFAGSAVADRRP
jgi:hypothetical protein